MTSRTYEVLVVEPNSPRVHYELAFSYNPTLREVLESLQNAVTVNNSKESEWLEVVRDEAHKSGVIDDLFNESDILRLSAPEYRWLQIWCPDRVCLVQFPDDSSYCK